MKRIYFDNAATTKLSPEVLEAMLPYLTENFGNASSTYHEGRQARLGIETARQQVAICLNAKRSEIIFTSGGTESNNLAIRSVVRDMKINSVITARTEHKSVLSTIEDLKIRGQVKVCYVKLMRDGSIDLADLDKLLSENGPSLVSLMHANNETGNMIDLGTVGSVCKRHRAIFHSDTVQTVGHYPTDLRSLPVDLITGSGHKFHGPKGSGILFIREGLEIQPVTTGGGQENGLRAGTENTAAIVGFAEALNQATSNMCQDSKHIEAMKKRLIGILTQSGVPSNGNTSFSSLYTVVNAAFPNNEQTRSLLMDLDMAGISASGGSACSAGKGGSHVMEAMNATHTNNIRFSFSKYNTMEELDLFESIVKRCLQEACV